MATQREAWDNLYLKNTDLKNAQKTVKMHDDNFVTYEEDMLAVGYKEAPIAAAKLLLHHMGNVETGSRIFDVGAGTGWVGEALKNNGFHGKVDAIDGSKGMLEKAREKGIYDKIFCHYLCEENPMPVGKDFYDGAVSSAAFGAGYIHFLIISQVIKDLKKGGVFAIVVRRNTSVPEYQINFEKNLKNLTESKIIEELEVKEIGRYYSVNYDDGGVVSTGCTTANIYCYKKL